MRTNFNRVRKLAAVALCVLALLSLSVLAIAAEEGVVPAPAEKAGSEGEHDVSGVVLQIVPAPAEKAGSEVLKGLFSGTSLALLGAALAVALPCIGSAKGVGIVGEAASGLLSENPSLFGKALLLQALPMTQGIYGMVTAFMIMLKIGLFGNPDYLTTLSFTGGAYYLMASLPIAIAGMYSAIRQARVSAAGVNLLSKRPAESGKAVTSAALVETYAILALLISILLILNSPFSA